MQQSRRDFVLGVGSLAAASVLPAIAGPKESDIKFGYAAITWDGNDTQAIKDVSEVGFRGIQLRANILKEFSDDPKKVADLLQQYKLQFVAFLASKKSSFMAGRCWSWTGFPTARELLKNLRSLARNTLKRNSE